MNNDRHAAAGIGPLPIRTPSGQRGLALVTAVLIVALVATLAASIALGQQIWLRQAQNFNDRAQADKVAEGGYQWALQTLEDDAKNHAQTDDKSEDWAKKIAVPVEGGAVAGNITDAQGRFNLNNLARNGTPSAADIGIFGRLLQALSLNSTQLTDSLVDWMDADSEPRPNGAEDIYYLSLQPPYRAANQPLQSVDELRLVRGFDAQTVEKLRPFVIALPVPTPVNINTAEPEVLSALFNALPLSTAKQLTAERDKNRNPFHSNDELAARAGQPVADKVEFSVTSNYFIVQIDTRFGRLQRTRRALVERPLGGGKPASLLWQEFTLGVPPSTDKPAAGG
jgi:general secretion pathway protein K